MKKSILVPAFLGVLFTGAAMRMIAHMHGGHPGGRHRRRCRRSGVSSDVTPATPVSI